MLTYLSLFFKYLVQGNYLILIKDGGEGKLNAYKGVAPHWMLTKF